MTHTEELSADMKRLSDLIKGIRFAMFTTAQADGTMHSRPMATQGAPFDGDLWFFTSISSGKVHEIQADQHVNLAYADPDSNRYVSVSGIANIVQDRRKADELWSPELKAWFPGGADDPDLALIHVVVSEAQYWDAPSSKMVMLAKYAKALITGERPKNMGENKKIDFQSSD